MPYRKHLLANNETYHVFNKTVNDMPIFEHKGNCERLLHLLWYYRYKQPILSYSKYLSLNHQNKVNFHNLLVEQPLRADCLAFVLMPNHYHLLVTQKIDDGISKFVGEFQNAFSRWFNTKNNRKGPLFLPQFKATRIESESQLEHVSRYIHLNPVTGFLIKDPSKIDLYPWSSWHDYKEEKVNDAYSFVNSQPVLANFSSMASYSSFVLNQADYQRKLAENKHLTFNH